NATVLETPGVSVVKGYLRDNVETKGWLRVGTVKKAWDMQI
ncbi:242_t:CDS:2, partial [Diversispora eburnea]